MLEFDSKDETAFPHKETTQAIIGAAFEVHNRLGYGYLHRVCQASLQVELTRRHIRAELEKRIDVIYKDVVVGYYDADMIVEDSVLIEIKIAPEYDKRDEAQSLRTHLINRNGCVAGDLALRQGARRENILYGSLSDEQRRGSAKDPATLGAEFVAGRWRRCSSVTEPYGYAPSSRLARRPSQLSAPIPIYEMGSNLLKATGLKVGVLINFGRYKVEHRRFVF
jgi:GxxExxY protein